MNLDPMVADFLKANHVPIFKKRYARDYVINEQLSNRLADTLNKIKGKTDQQLAQSGKLDVESFIQYKIDKRSKSVPNFNIFNQQIETRGLDVLFLVDCSGSMTWGSADEQLKNLSATIFKALEKCPFINFKVIAFSGKGHNARTFDYRLVVDEIEELKDCSRINGDSDDRLTPTPLIMDYALEKLAKSENKKLIILFTDGLPESVKDYENIPYSVMQELTKMSIIKTMNKKIDFFVVFYKNMEYFTRFHKPIEDIRQKMYSLFTHYLYETENFNDVETILVKQLIKAVERINQK